MERDVLISPQMKTTLGRSFPLIGIFLATSAWVQAHPGHDDGHDVTWDFSAGHLAAHPFATVIGALVLVAGAWAVARLLSQGSARLVQATRRSDRRD